MTDLSHRFRDLVQSDIRRMSRECDRVGGINLGQGICDLPTEDLVMEGAIEAIRANKATYSRFEGIAELREKIARKAREFNRIECDPETDVVVTVGATGGFATAALATVDPGSEVILFEPYYGYHVNTLRSLGIAMKFVALEPPEWRLSIESLRNAFSGKTRAVVICTPSNPCGKVFTRDELEAIGDLCAEHDAWIITDEIYEYIVYDGREHVSIASIDRFRNRTITISGYSKTFSITGWRIGYAIAEAEVARAIGLANDLFYVCAPTPLQWGVAGGLDIGPDYYTSLRRDYQIKRDLLAGALKDAGFEPFIPEGAYYMLADVTEMGFESDHAAADALLEEAKVASVPASAFFQNPRRQLLRFCFAKETPDLEEACSRIRRFRR